MVICQGGYNDGLSEGEFRFLFLSFYSDSVTFICFPTFSDEYNKACSYYSPWMLTALCGIFIVLYQSFLEFVATCGCLQGKKTFQNNCCGSMFKSCIQWCGGRTLSFATFVSFVLLVWAVIACYVLNVDYRILSNILLSKVWSMGEWFVWSAPYFCYRYPIDRRYFYMRLLRREKSGKHVSVNSSTNSESDSTTNV
jgi:hypothetical protein